MIAYFIGCTLSYFLAATNETPESFLKELSLKRAAVGTLYAQMRLENTTPEQKTESRGTVLYIRPNRLVFRIFDGENEEAKQVFVVDSNKVYEYDASIEQLQIYDLGENREMRAIFSAFESDLTQLQDYYDIELFEPGDAADRAVQGLMLVPKNLMEDRSRLFERVRVYLRDKDYLPTLIHVVNDADSEAVMYFDDLKVDPILPRHADQIALPKGTKIIENDDKVRTVRTEVEYIPESLLKTTSDTQPDKLKTK